MEMTAAIQYIMTAEQSLGSQDYHKKSRMTILRLAGVLFCENEKGYTEWITWMLREARGDLKATIGNRVTTRLSLCYIVFCSFLFLSTRVLFSLAGYARKHANTYWTLWA